MTKYKHNKRNTTSHLQAKKKYTRPTLIIVLTSIALLVAANIQTTHNLTAYAQNVLGDDEQSEEQKNAEEQQKEATKQVEETQKESAKQATEQQKENEKTTTNTVDTSEPPRTSIKSKTETVSQSGVKMKTEIENEKQETEIETTDGQKIKTKTEDDGTTNIEIENGTVKLRYSVVNGQVVLNVENEDGEEVEIEDAELEELENDVEDTLGDDNVSLTPSTNNQMALTQNQVTAVTDLPLSIDVETKELSITTPTGQKVVTVLPEEAVKNLLATGIITNIGRPPSGLTFQNQLDTIAGVVDIESRDNQIVYKIKGNKTHLVFGVLPITTPVTAFVSSETGQTLAKQQSILTDVIDLLAP